MKTYLGVAKMFTACNMKPEEYSDSRFYEITEQLEEYYNDKQLLSYGLETTSKIRQAIKDFVENELLIVKAKGKYLLDISEELDKSHQWLLRTADRKLEYVVRKLEENPNKYFIKSFFINDKGFSTRTYFVTEKGFILLTSNLK